MDDRDLDDAQLWAVIDSAAASRSRKPLLALKSTPSSASNPSLLPYRNPNKHHLKVDDEGRVPADGEVVQHEEIWAHRRAQKAARFVDSVEIEDRRMVAVRHHALPAPPPPVSPPVYGSPEIGRFMVKEVSPVMERPSPEAWKTGKEENLGHSLLGQFPSVSAFKQYQDAAMAILEKSDYTMISGSPYIKKSGWRKISFFFNISFEIKDKSIEFDENQNVRRAEFVIRAFMQGGRFSDGWGSCDRREKKFLKPNHDIPSTAETRAKNKASQDLLGIGQVRPMR
ncbi:uncharacterized protein [Typha latifolia]|uniref:uncharacterized protein n=1 Tax=Typha latifolia TaxID=4733 RepID=UPI003C2BEFB0